MLFTIMDVCDVLLSPVLYISAQNEKTKTKKKDNPEFKTHKAFFVMLSEDFLPHWYMYVHAYVMPNRLSAYLSLQ